MALMIVGVDVSSRRIDLAWLEDGKPRRWHQELGGPKTHLIDRLRSIRIQWPNDIFIVPGAGHGVTDIAIEYPFAVQKPAVAALMATVGVITRQAPPWARVAWPSAGELRAAIGARNTKAAAHEAIYDLFPGPSVDYDKLGYVSRIGNLGQLAGWTPDELDALVACLGWSAILAAQDAA